jgi:hypothetical protein
MKKTAICLSVLLAACGGGGDSSVQTQSNSSKLTCSNFSYQEDAQANLWANPSLDGDKDGIACENLPSRPKPTNTPTPQANISATGLWKGQTNSNRTMTALVFANGSYYVFYSRNNDPSVIAGVIQGQGSITGNNFNSGNAKDFNLEGAGILDATVSSTVASQSSLNGSVSYANTSYGTTTFNSSYSKDFESSPSLSAVAGSYLGSVSSFAGTEVANVTISNSGAITGSGQTSGCSMTGTLTPRNDANAYNVTLTFGASPCLLANQTITGISYFDASAKRLYAAAPNATRTDGVLFVGTKP